jgi:hypothetical protein
MLKVWVKDSNCRGLTISPIHIGLKNKNEIVSGRQYPVPKEGKKGVQPVVEGLLKDGILKAWIVGDQ